MTEINEYGTWRIGNNYGSVVSDVPTGHDDNVSFNAYGGFMVCESVFRHDIKHLISAAPDLLAALREAVEFHGDEDNETIARWRAAIAKAEGNT